MIIVRWKNIRLTQNINESKAWTEERGISEVRRNCLGIVRKPTKETIEEPYKEE